MGEIVSNFELIFKPQSPSDPIGTPGVATVLQGYFLAITNLGEEEYGFLLEFISVDPTGATADVRVLDDNNVFLVDTPDGNNEVGRVRSFGDEVHTPTTGRITIPPQGTALAVLLPQAFPIPAGNDVTPLAGPNFEVRGYVRIRLPANIRFRDIEGGRIPGLGGRFPIFEPQADGPVQVLCTPQYRATYTDADGNVTDQTQSTVPTGTGSAIITVEPESGFRPLPIEGRSGKSLSAGSLESMLDAITPERSAGMIAALLSQMGEDAESMKALNAALKAADVKVTLKKP